MSRVTLIRWNKKEEAGERLTRLRNAGHRADTLDFSGPAAVRSTQQDPPDAFVIDLARQPSMGRDLGILLRRRKATRLVPIVFVGGEPSKVARVKKLLPDAVYATWRGIGGAIGRATRRAASQPVVPGMLDGYSGTPLPKKLGIKAGAVVALLGAPAGFERSLGKLPADVTFRKQARGRADLILLFCKSVAELKRRFPAALRALDERGGIWLAWPKKASGMSTDLTEREVRAFGLGSGLVDFKIAAIDSTWSGLKFTRRRKK